MKKPVKQYNGVNDELKEVELDTEEKFYMCEYVDLFGKVSQQESRNFEP